MPQFFIRKEAIANGWAEVEGDEAHHARDVFRLKRGDAIKLFDGEGNGFGGRVADVSRSRLRVEIVTRAAEPAPRMRVTLAQSVLPRDAMDWVIEKAVELGVSEIAPVMPARSVARLDPKRRTEKKEHWEKLVLAACKQCERLRLPSVRDAVRLEDLEPAGEGELLIMPHPAEGAEPLSNCLETAGAKARVRVIVGPEGGFTDEEAAQWKSRGARIVSLGKNLMRSETASLFVLSALKLKFCID